MNWDFGYTVSASELKAGGCGGWFSFVCAGGKIPRVSAVKLSLALADESLLLSKETLGLKDEVQSQP